MVGDYIGTPRVVLMEFFFPTSLNKYINLISTGVLIVLARIVVLFLSSICAHKFFPVSFGEKDEYS